METYFNKLICLECGHEMAAAIAAVSCEMCGSPWLDARYDYDAVRKKWAQPITNRERSLWRYSELLPIPEPNHEISMGEGFTPLTRLYQYEQAYDHQMIFVKDERSQPTNSFKDRQAALSVTAMKQRGITEAVLASTGNAAVAYAAYCARAGIKLWLFLTSLVPPEKMREVALYGAEVVKVSGTYDETKKVAAAFAKRKGIVMDKGAKTIPAKESMKTMAYEIAEQLGLALHPEQPGKWLAPDWYIQSVSGGIGPIGVWKGFEELHQMGLIDKMPKLAIVQAAGCAPMVQAFQAGKDTADPVVPKTLVHVLATGDPGFGYVLLNRATRSNGGIMLAVEDGKAFAAMRRVAAKAGLSVEPATAVAFAGLEQMLTDGTIQPNETVVINATGHTLPAESHILGDQYDKYILDLPVNGGGKDDDTSSEGLGAALKNLDEQVTTVVIVDDNPNDRRLIRRLLQSYKSYRVYEAGDGAEAVHVIKDRMPDLVVCDLTMPEMDGFGLLEAIKNDPLTAHIPMVVVSAKDLTLQDRQILENYSDSVWMKGGFDTRQLVEHVVDTLGHTPVGVIASDQNGQSDDAAVTDDEEILQTNITGETTIVMIDDNPSDLRLARKMLQSDKSYHIIEATSGRAGLKAIYNYHPDLIVLDLMMPDVDGFDIIETLSNDHKLRDIPVIIVSARTITEQERLDMKKNIRQTLEKASLDRRRFLDIINKELR
jgi:threonine synthase